MVLLSISVCKIEAETKDSCQDGDGRKDIAGDDYKQEGEIGVEVGSSITGGPTNWPEILQYVHDCRPILLADDGHKCRSRAFSMVMSAVWKRKGRKYRILGRV